MKEHKKWESPLCGCQREVCEVHWLWRWRHAKLVCGCTGSEKFQHAANPPNTSHWKPVMEKTERTWRIHWGTRQPPNIIKKHNTSTSARLISQRGKLTAAIVPWIFYWPTSGKLNLLTAWKYLQSLHYLLGEHHWWQRFPPGPLWELLLM